MAKQARKQKRSKSVGPKYPAKLLKELGQPLELNDRRRRHSRKSQKKESDEAGALGGDVYEYEEGVPQEESGKNRRFDEVDKLEYELPKDFEDEEIDEDAAFGEENPSRGGEEDEFDLGGSEDDDGDDEHEGDEELHDKMLEEVTGRTRRRGRRKDEEEEDDDRAELEDPEVPITVDDLLAPLQEQPGFNALKKKMRALQRHAAPVAVPLPRVLQEKLDRKAGYEKTSEEITRWQPLVKKNREAATINFVKDVDVSLATTGLMAAAFKPSTNLEKEIDALLHESRVYDSHQVEFAENLELNKLSVEEVKNRQDRLAKMRSLLFRHEERAKRLKKIKSKAYHRMTRKAMKGKADILIEDPEQQKEEAMKQEINRARERMTLKHKNTTRWAKRILKRGIQQYDEGTREAITEQLRKHALLTQKISSVGGESSSSDDESEVDEETEEGLVLGSKKAMAKAKMATLKELEEGDNEAEIPKTGIFSLPFMVRAIERKRKEAENEARAVLEELEQAEAGDDRVQQQEPLKRGKLSFGSSQKPSAKENGVEDEEMIDRGSSESEHSEDDDDTRPTKRKRSVIKPKKKTTKAEAIRDTSELQGMVEAPAEHTLSVDAPIAVDSTSTRKAKKKKRRKNKKGELGGQAHSVIDANPTIFGAGKLASSTDGNKKPEMGGEVTIAGRPRQIPAEKKGPEGAGTGEESDDEAGDSDEEDDDEEQLIAGRSQEELIREAFAGDDVEAEFERLKAEAADKEGPRGAVEDLDLPGWGQWTDVQKKRGPPKWLVKQQEDVKKEQEAAKQRRLDAKLKNVIVSEKVDKKAAKFMTSSLPFPFTSKEVFENSIRMPLGPDFNTSQAFRELTRPAEIKRAGVIIDPIEYEKPEVKKRKLPQNQQAPLKVTKSKLR